MAIISIQKITKGLNLIKLLLRKYKLGITGIILLGLLSGFFGGIGVSIVIPLFSIITNQETAAPNFIIEFIKNTFSLLRIPINAAVLIFTIILLFALKAFVQFLAKYINERMTATYEKDAREKLFEKTIKTSWPNLMKYKGGYLERVLLFDIGQSAAVINLIGSITLIFTSFLVYTIIAFSISAAITLSTIAFGIAIFFFLKPIFYRIRKLIKEMADNEKKVSHQINESIAGAKTIKSYSAEENVIKKSISIFQQLKLTRIRLAVVRNLLGQFGEPTGMIVIGTLFLIMSREPNFDIASFAVAVYLIQKMFNSIQNIQTQLNKLNELIPYLNITHKYYENALKNIESSSDNKKFEFNDKLELRDIHFSYESKKILSGVNLIIEKNSSVGLIGASGVGKTTIVDLIMRLLKPQKGEILLDGIEAEKFNISEWRKNIGYVAQEVFLINDTIENNIRFFDESISQKDIIDAAKQAYIFETISKMKNGFKEVVGERGIELSAGQRQRIAIARALARKPKILILDEATSALDNESEQAIHLAIDKLQGKITIIIIAHRLSTIMETDKLAVLDNGKIVEEGKPNDLLQNKDSHFYRIYNIIKQ